MTQSLIEKLVVVQPESRIPNSEFVSASWDSSERKETPAYLMAYQTAFGLQLALPKAEHGGFADPQIWKEGDCRSVFDQPEFLKAWKAERSATVKLGCAVRHSAFSYEEHRVIAFDDGNTTWRCKALVTDEGGEMRVQQGLIRYDIEKEGTNRAGGYMRWDRSAWDVYASVGGLAFSGDLRDDGRGTIGVSGNIPTEYRIAERALPFANTLTIGGLAAFGSLPMKLPNDVLDGEQSLRNLTDAFNDRRPNSGYLHDALWMDLVPLTGTR